VFRSLTETIEKEATRWFVNFSNKCNPVQPGEQQPGQAAGPAAGDEAGPSGSGRRGRGGGIFAPTVEDVFDNQLAEQMGLQPAKNRKKQRARARWRQALLLWVTISGNGGRQAQAPAVSPLH
jgi:hypothetical protein